MSYFLKMRAILGERLTTRIASGLIVIILILFSIIILGTQNRIVGWEPGYDELQPGHHGWVSSHTLAVISNASADNYFVGYAQAFLNENGTIDYDYFDRYPVFFSASMRVILSITDRLSSKVYIAKQIMNLIFIATVVVAFLITDLLLENKIAAMSAAILSVSSEYLLFYKDMIHFDQPALFGFLLLIYTIGLFYVKKMRIAPYLGAIIAVSLGRGYASFAVLLTWLAIETFLTLQDRRTSVKNRIKRVLALDVTRICALALTITILFLLFNLSIEAMIREIPLSETSIFKSAQNRLALNDDFNESYANILSWKNFFIEQLDRIVRWGTPLRKNPGSFLENSIIVLIQFAIIGVFMWRVSREKRIIVALLILSGFVWLIPMRNLTAFHDYTSMYYLGIPIAFLCAVFSILDVPRNPALNYLLLITSLALFLTANANTQDLHIEHGRYLNVYTHDFMRIRDKLPHGESNYIHLNAWIPNAPYASGFYLPEHILSPYAQADYIITDKPIPGQESLTPENTRLFLYKK